MPFVVKARIYNRTLSENAETAKEAFAQAVEWQAAGRFCRVSIDSGRRRFTIAEFSWTMASQEVANTAHIVAKRQRMVLTEVGQVTFKTLPAATM